VVVARRPPPRRRARTGDVAVVRKEHTIWRREGGELVHDLSEEYEIVVLSAVTGDGLVRGYRDSGGGEVDFHRLRRQCSATTMLAPGIDPERAMEVARAHHHPDDPARPVPFTSLDEVRAALRPLIG